jgi:hypothetical protein
VVPDGRATETAALASVRALHNLCAGNVKGQRHCVVSGVIQALLERLKLTYRQGMRRKGEAAAQDNEMKEAVLSALRNALVDHPDAQVLLNALNGLPILVENTFYMRTHSIFECAGIAQHPQRSPYPASSAHWHMGHEPCGALPLARSTARGQERDSPRHFFDTRTIHHFWL